MQRLLAAHQRSLQGTRAAAQRAHTRAPLPNPAEYILYGTVRDTTGAAAPDVNVSVSHSGKAVVQTTTTAADGSYTLYITSADLGKETHDDDHASAEAEGPHDEKAKARRSRRARPKRPHPRAVRQLAASDPQRTYHVEAPATFEFALGKLAVQDMTVPASGSVSVSVSG